MAKCSHCDIDVADAIECGHHGLCCGCFDLSCGAPLDVVNLIRVKEGRPLITKPWARRMEG